MPQDLPQDPGDARDESQDELIRGHSYDGIKEYDNPMPGWWVWTFWATVVFAVVYAVGINVGWIDTYEDDLAEGVAELAAMRAAYAESNPTFDADPATLAAYVGDAAHIKNGSEPYTAYCAACHGAAGEGLIGPNLADAYWIHGAEPIDIYEILTVGVPTAGMPPWDNVLSPEERAEVTAFVLSLQGTDPPNAKEPQGELVE